MTAPSTRTIGLTRENGVASFRGVVLPPGPWHSEPDHEDFRSSEGLPCILHRSSLGAWCGYVGVSPGHPWHGRDYSAIDSPYPEVHGGLTYSERCRGPLCHVPKPSESDDVWWLGFDCNHSGDLSLWDVAEGRQAGRAYGWTESYRPIGYARAETLSLAAQAHSVAATVVVGIASTAPRQT